MKNSTMILFGIVLLTVPTFPITAQTIDEPAIDPSYIFGTPTPVAPQQPTSIPVVTPSKSDIVLIWEASGYVPPFYRGKKLYTKGTDLTVAAIPDIVVHGRRLSTGELVFSWEKDGTLLGAQSGLGNNKITIPGSLLARDTTISVAIATSGGSPLGSERITIPLSNPLVVLYEENPALGTVFSRGIIGTHTLVDEEVTLGAYPYFFDTTNRNTLIYTWSLGTTKESSQSVTLRAPDVDGTIPVHVSVKNPNIPGQMSETKTSIIY